MNMFLLSIGIEIPGSVQISDGIYYRGPMDLTKETDEHFVVFVGDLEAAYSKAQVELSSKRVKVESDVTGQLAFRYIRRTDGHIIASHDILLAPFMEMQIRRSSLESIERVGWSVGGQSLIEGIEVFEPASNTTLSPDGSLSSEPIEFPSGELDPRKYVEFLHKRLSNSTVFLELSAGLDSRAALSATLAGKEASSISAFSEGDPESLDVTVAREICRRNGIAFECRPTPRPTKDDFLQAWTQSSIVNNGHIEIDILASRGQVDETICGEGGEVHKGYFYPYRPLHRVLGGKVESNKKILLDRYGQSDELEYAISRIQHGARSNEEVLDRFYLIERFGVWHQKLARDPRKRISPFYCRSAMTDLGKGLFFIPHIFLISEFLPNCLDIHVNGMFVPGDIHNGRSIKNIPLEYRMFTKKLRRRLLGSSDLKDTRIERIRGFASQVSDEFLYEPGTTWASFGAQRFLKLFDNLSSKGVDGLGAYV